MCLWKTRYAVVELIKNVKGKKGTNGRKLEALQKKRPKSSL